MLPLKIKHFKENPRIWLTFVMGASILVVVVVECLLRIPPINKEIINSSACKSLQHLTSWPRIDEKWKREFKSYCGNP